ncbi:MAG: CBS domain-containing protein [Thermoanaerobacterales bacterium]|nr:CBS domain-containing protein [Thermoanaerobacterales bacterium]
MPYEKTAKDLMLPLESYPAVTLDDTVGTAVARLKEATARGFRTLLVAGGDGQPLGVISQRTILRAMQPDFVITESWVLPVWWRGFFTAKCREEARKKVREVMRPLNFISVNASDPISKAVHLMVSNNVGTLPVVENGRVTGILRSHGIFDEICTLIEGNNPAPAGIPAPETAADRHLSAQGPRGAGPV